MVSPRDYRDPYTLNLHGRYQTLDDLYAPTEGTLVRFGVTQALDLGSQSTSFTRLSANFAQFIPAPGFNDGDHSVLLNIQAGTVLGRPPQLAGFLDRGWYVERLFRRGGEILRETTWGLRLESER